MSEDVDEITIMMNQLEKIMEIGERITSDTNKHSIDMLNLGKEISKLEHRVEELERENTFLKMMLKEYFGYNTNVWS